MGGMKDEAKRITMPPLFPRVHVNDTRKGGLSHPFHGKSMSLYKNKISDSPSTLSLSLPSPPNNVQHTDRIEKNRFSPIGNTCPVSENRKGMNYPSLRGSSPSITITKPKQNECHFNNIDSLKVPFVRRDTQANTDLSLQAAGSKASLNNLQIGELLLPECLEDARTLSKESQKKPKTMPPLEQDVSECSAIDSVSGMTASSNDIARVIGDKRFWKMRTYMINQQKIFAAQVFELHRLIMVQKLVAESPNLVFESQPNGSKPDQLEMAASRVKKPNTISHKTVSEEVPEHMEPKFPLPSFSKELVTPIWPRQLLPPPPPPPENQWLVPVMSPSEGLVYKPYAGPCPPPSSAFMVPICGKDSLNTTFRFPVSSHNYFPPPNTRTVHDQTNQMQRWSSSSSHITQAIPISLKKSQESNDSTATSPPEKQKFELLPLFPTEPTHHAIKAIPHNPTSTSESAARIFRSIQEERRDSDYMIC